MVVRFGSPGVAIGTVTSIMSAFTMSDGLNIEANGTSVLLYSLSVVIAGLLCGTRTLGLWELPTRR
jgi:hypothetical protein